MLQWDCWHFMQKIIFVSRYVEASSPQSSLMAEITRELSESYIYIFYQKSQVSTTNKLQHCRNSALTATNNEIILILVVFIFRHLLQNSSRYFSQHIIFADLYKNLFQYFTASKTIQVDIFRHKKNKTYFIMFYKIVLTKDNQIKFFKYYFTSVILYQETDVVKSMWHTKS